MAPEAQTTPRSRARARHVLVALLGLAGAAVASCAAEVDDGVARVELGALGVTGAQLGGVAVSEVFGLYGASCLNRSGSWSLPLGGSAVTQYPPLTVLLGDAACKLTLTGVVVDALPLRATPSVVLETSFRTTPALLTDAAGIAKLGVQAKLSSSTFEGDVRLDLLLGQQVATRPEVDVRGVVVYRVGGTVSGLSREGLVLALSGGGATSVLPVASAGPFAFPTRLPRGAYSVVVLAQPAGEACVVRSGLGTIRDADIDTVSVTCVPKSCDDGNRASGDGCSADRRVESGWTCPTLGAACVSARCGDGIVAGDEECDDGDALEDNGCTNACLLTAGFTCPASGGACARTVCGDGRREGSEQCDDGNTMPFDGCSPTCTAEPSCPKSGGACTGTCGDGIIFPGEECDDGNVRAGDGCSPTCKVESGFSCRAVTSALASSIDVPIIYRDFSRGDAATVAASGGFAACNLGCPSGHPDFQTISGAMLGMVGRTVDDDADPSKVGTLDAEGKPVLRCIAPSTCKGSGCASAPGASTCAATSVARFAQWYRDIPGGGSTARVNHTFSRTLPLALVGAGTSDLRYQFSSSAFFPIDNLGFGNQADVSPNQNFHFTSELRFWLLYDAASAPQFDFRGDDDVFVFLNGKLVVDIGGVHGAISRSFTLTPTLAAKLGMTTGRIYEFALFQAERRRSGSNYQLTLRGFVRAKSVCTSTCGDGVVTRYEACDDGAANDKNIPPLRAAYGKCSSNCLSRGPRCGDGVVDLGEYCDDGDYNGSYGLCDATCKGPGPHCGDGIVQEEAGEACDDGVRNDTADPPASGRCSSDCAARGR